jgi:hypothetical protein
MGQGTKLWGWCSVLEMRLETTRPMYTREKLFIEYESTKTVRDLFSYIWLIKQCTTQMQSQKNIRHGTDQT